MYDNALRTNRVDIKNKLNIYMCRAIRKRASDMVMVYKNTDYPKRRENEDITLTVANYGSIGCGNM